jgi:WD40 repeat protein
MDSNRKSLAIIMGFLLISQLSCSITPTIRALSPVMTVPTENNTTSITSTVEPGDYFHLQAWQSVDTQIRDIKWVPNEDKYVIVVSNAVSLHEAATGKVLWKLTPDTYPGSPSGVAFPSGGKTMIVYVEQGGLKIIDIATGQLLAEKQKEFNSANCRTSTSDETILSQDNRTLIVSTENIEKYDMFSQLQLWDVPSMNCIAILDEINGHTRSLDISSDGRYLALGMGVNTTLVDNIVKESGHVSVWDLQSREIICEIIDYASNAHFRPGSSLLAVANPDKNEINYWDIDRCTIDSALTGTTARYGFTFTPDGNSISILNDGILIIDADHGKILQELDTEEVNTIDPLVRLSSILSFSDSGKYLLLSVGKYIYRYYFDPTGI